MIDSPCRSTKPFMAAPSLWFTRSSGWRSRLSKSNPDHLGIAAFGCGPRPRYVVRVTYADSDGTIDASTIGTDDISISGLGTPTASIISGSGTASTVVDYTFSPPGGTW